MVFLSLSLTSTLLIANSFEATKVRAATLTDASATLSNPRLSYRAQTTVGASGTSSITVNSAGSYPDLNTYHLFPNDNVCFLNEGITGCIGNVSYSVATISGVQTFSLSSPLTNNVDTNGYVTATESGNISIAFTLASTIPIGGDIVINVPVASTGNVNDGIPDSGADRTSDGFDFNRLEPTSVNVSSTGGTCINGWDTPVVASASGTITITKATSSCAGATVTIVIPNLVNPTPFTSGHTQGQADNYKIAIATRDAGDNVLDVTNVGVAPVEGVLVSATVDQTLSFTVAGVTADSGSFCGVTRTAGTTDSTATSIPWGTIAAANTFLNADQSLTISTNAGNGYSVKIEENDQMGMNGITCTGSTAGEADNCIKDTTCDSGSCSESTSGDWNTSTNNGFGYSLANVAGTDASFLFDESARAFSAKQISDQEASEVKQSVMANGGPVSAKQVYVCYRISISGIQPAGYYFNKVKYTATALF
ncbi:MAG: hypothetical protein US68_C0032G0004 [Candidatus Shapirobacteria bacterium GW2011_GWE1_38_10]|uniref:Uncharacterized protein n=1 Tax=Candidatus Shapirobacteria bacterium GW2011_GWE1_38_10 TaxID=1618488 RepID=A0A0G0HZB4_9BACT|nr:MAG: hypothetical protein US68_C0032G0004 [Candidatus Shapirobacteria bacterium GW2011_GWE1_38_10]